MLDYGPVRLSSDWRIPLGVIARYQDPDEPSRLPLCGALASLPWIAGGVALVLLASIGLYRLTSRSPRIDSIAVLPLENLSGIPEQEYFSDGMTDELNR